MNQRIETYQIEENHSDRNRWEILWKPVLEGAQILRVYGNQLELKLPDRIEGYPITEIGAYCFSASERLPKEDCFLTSVTEQCEERIERATLPSISGSYVESVFLPDTVTTIHNAAFYNCRQIQRLSIGKEILAIGSDVFMNCGKLADISVRYPVEEASGLFLLLERLITDVEVSFYDLEHGQKHLQTRLFFPEYYEWLDEITPAHIFSRSIEGEGYRMRHVFDGRTLDLRKYDQCFAGVLIGESDRNICRIAMDRLRWPVNLPLEGEFRASYEKALKERNLTALDLMIAGREVEGLEFLCRTCSPGKGELTVWMEKCIAADWGEGSAYLLEQKHKAGSFAKKEFTFDDFF